LIDILILVAIILYGVVGFYTGLIHRIIGFFGLYLGFLVGTYIAPTAASVLQQSVPNWNTPDSLIVSYFVLVAFITLLVEGFAAGFHKQIQVTYVAFDHLLGLLIGLATAIVGVTVTLALLEASSHPPAGSADAAEITMSTRIHQSSLAPTIISALGQPVLLLFSPVVPGDPAAWFNGIGVSANPTG